MFFAFLTMEVISEVAGLFYVSKGITYLLQNLFIP
jgi:hypothetical protein